MPKRKDRIPIRDILLYGFLPSFLKILIYRLRGYKIGKKVIIGFGSVICGDKVKLGDHVSIGFLTVIRGKTITIDRYAIVGSTTFIDTPNIAIGEGTRINEQVFVGGLQFPDSKFLVGRNCLIQQMSFINPSPDVIIGDDTAIGGHSLIFGHVSWQNCFEGYPVEFSSIEIGNHVGIGWRAFILPGSKIEDGAMVGANSVVNRNIPPRCLAVGFPARIVSKEPDFPKTLSQEEKVQLLRKILDEMMYCLSSEGYKILSCADEIFEIYCPSKAIFFRTVKKCKVKTVFKDIDEGKLEGLGESDIIISLKIMPHSIRSTLNKRNIQWMDIESKEYLDIDNPLGPEIVAYFKRYGVRFNRTCLT